MTAAASVTKGKKKKNEKPRGRHWKRKLKPAVGTPEELVFRSSSLFVLEPRGGGVRKQEHEGLTKGTGIDSVCRSCQSISVLLFVVSLSPEILRNLPTWPSLWAYGKDPVGLIDGHEKPNIVLRSIVQHQPNTLARATYIEFE